MAGVVIALIAAFRIAHLERYFSLSYLEASKESLAALYSEHRVAVPAIYMGIYIAAAALSLPGATVLTLAGGALFGLAAGTVMVSFASTIGATVACFVSRFLLRDWVHRKFGDKLETINRGIEQEGAWYLFTLRLIPIFPFFVINLAMGVMKMKLFTFYWVSQAGMLAGTVVYVNAGEELGRLESLSGILSPRLLASFVILGLFPITVKKIMAFVRARTGSARSDTGRKPFEG